MAGGPDVPSTKTGIAKYFDTYTNMGRRNCTLATYSAFALIFVYFKFFKKGKNKE